MVQNKSPASWNWTTGDLEVLFSWFRANEKSGVSLFIELASPDQNEDLHVSIIFFAAEGMRRKWA